jgi:hypothetical protein
MTQPFPGGLTAPNDWIDGILPMLPGASLDWIKNEILIKLRTFFDTSGAWRDWIGPITLDSTTPYYSPELTDYKAELCNVFDMIFEESGTHLSMCPRSHQFKIFDHGTPTYFSVTSEGLLQIWPVVNPDVLLRVFAYVTMKPIDLCVPDWIKLRYFDAIRSGVLSAGYFMPGLNYKPDLAARYERRFRSEMSRATLSAITNQTAMAVPKYITTMGIKGSQRGGFATTAVSG